MQCSILASINAEKAGASLSALSVMLAALLQPTTVSLITLLPTKLSSMNAIEKSTAEMLSGSHHIISKISTLPPTKRNNT